VIERGGIFVRQEHTGRVFRLQFDEFQIVSSSHDDTILIWDFLNYNDTNSSGAGSSNNVVMHGGGATHANDTLTLPILPPGIFCIIHNWLKIKLPLSITIIFIF